MLGFPAGYTGTKKDLTGTRYVVLGRTTSFGDIDLAKTNFTTDRYGFKVSTSIDCAKHPSTLVLLLYFVAIYRKSKYPIIYRTEILQ